MPDRADTSSAARHALFTRRWLVAACLALAPLLALAQAATPTDRVSLDAAQVQGYLEGVFPQQQDALGGLVTLELRNPRLSIPATGSRLALQFDASVAAPGRGLKPVGTLFLSSGLRYDAQRQALFLESPTLDDLQPVASGGRVDGTTRELASAWLSDYARDEPIYQLDPALGAAMGGLKVVATDVQAGKIVIRFNQPLTLPAGVPGAAR